MWSGLFVIWFVYLNGQDENGLLLARLISPTCIIVIAVSVAVLYNHQSECARVEYKSLVADRSDGTEMVAVNKGRVRRGVAMPNSKVKSILYYSAS